MFIELLRKRRSLRKFTGRPLDGMTIDLITEALLRSPSSRGINPWEFVFVRERAMLERLSRAKKHSLTFLAGAALGIVILGNEEKTDTWIEDCSIAAIIVQLLAADLGLGSCWGHLRNRPHDATTSAEEYVQRLLNIPTHLRAGIIIGIGHPDEHKEPIPGHLLDNEKIHLERYHARPPR